MEAPPPVEAKFGTFKGVFTPSILTILGVIMYLRFGWVVGQGGLIGSIAVVLLAHVISITTGLSVSSIATNTTVKTGGDYYMISRSLGLPVGGAIGLALFFALAFSTSLYIIGFSESFLDIFGFDNNLFNLRIVGSITCVAMTGITIFSTSLALRLQYFVLGAIALSLISLFLGKPPSPLINGPQLWFSEGSESFETVFAVFFPAVTGFTAGVAMSGDLKEPRRAIPIGTLSAIFIGMAIYLAIPVFLSLNIDVDTLRTDQMAWMRIARVPQLVVAGVFAATLSSALGSVLGAPRYLQALAMDGVVPRFLGKGHGPLNEPRIGTIATFLIAEAGILGGELNLIARITTMFFLTSYGFICLASGVQTWSAVSSFRPDFKTPAWVSFVGALVSLGIMFKLDTLAMVGSTVVMIFVYVILKKRQTKSSPKDSWGGFWAALVQKGLIKLHSRTADPHNWRPNALVFGGGATERNHLVLLSHWLFQDRGLCTYFNIIKGSIRSELARAAVEEIKIRELIGSHCPGMLTRVTVSPSIYEGIRHVAQTYGLAGMTPNTVLMGWGEDSERPEEFTELVRDLLVMDHNLVFLNYDDQRGFGNYDSIDIWWGGMERNRPLMLLMAFFLTSSDIWSKSTVRLNVVVEDERAVATATIALKHMIRISRIRVELNVILRNLKSQPITSVISQVSGSTDLVIMGLAPPINGEGREFVDRVNSMLSGLGSVLLVRASSHFKGDDVLFDDA